MGGAATAVTLNRSFKAKEHPSAVKTQAGSLFELGRPFLADILRDDPKLFLAYSTRPVSFATATPGRVHVYKGTEQ